MRSAFVVALLVVALVVVGGCQCGLSRPGFEFRVFRPSVALEPHLIESRSNSLASLPLEPAGLRSFEPRVPPSQFSFPAPDLGATLAPPLPDLRLGWRPAPQAVPLDPCLMMELVRVLRRVDAHLGPEKLKAPRAVPCPEE